MDRATDLFERLAAYYGPQAWWPAETPFEVVVGALLMQQTSWTNVEEAIGNLKRAGLLSPHALASAPVSTIRKLVRMTGLYRTKPNRLKAFCRRLIEASGGDLERFFIRPTDVVRKDLLWQPGVGPETADSILLYAGGHPVFVVDAYTIRIAGRVGLIHSTDYERVQRYFDTRVPRETRVRKEYHALLVEHAKALCRPRPRCHACPVQPTCNFGRRQRP